MQKFGSSLTLCEVNTLATSDPHPAPRGRDAFRFIPLNSLVEDGVTPLADPHRTRTHAHVAGSGARMLAHMAGNGRHPRTAFHLRGAGPCVGSKPVPYFRPPGLPLSAPRPPCVGAASSRRRHDPHATRPYPVAPGRCACAGLAGGGGAGGGGAGAARCVPRRSPCRAARRAAPRPARGPAPRAPMAPAPTLG